MNLERFVEPTQKREWSSEGGGDVLEGPGSWPGAAAVSEQHGTFCPKQPSRVRIFF